MDEDIIEDLADAFAAQLGYIDELRPGTQEWALYTEATLDDIHCVAIVIHRHQPTYDLRYFYKRAGYPEPYPIHPID